MIVANNINGPELKKLRKELGYTQPEFAKKIGISRESIIKLEKGEKLSAGTMSLVENYLKSVYSVIGGSDTSTVKEPTEPYHLTRRKLKNTKDRAGVPVKSGFTTLGNIAVYSDSMTEKIIATLPAQLFPGCNYGERATGDSMYPLIINQAYLVGEIINSAEGITNGEKYIIKTREGIDTCKFVHRSTKKGIAVLKAYNKQIPDQEIEMEDIVFVCRVKYIINPT